MNSQNIFDKARKFGITKYQLGERIYGRDRLRNIYRLKIPSSKQEKELYMINRTVEEMIEEKANEKRR